MNMPTMHFKVLEKYLEIGVVVEEGFSLWIDDVDGEDAVVVVGLHEAAVVAQESEFLVEFELMTDYGFEMGHDVSPVIGQGEAGTWPRFPHGNRVSEATRGWSDASSEAYGVS